MISSLLLIQNEVLAKRKSVASYLAYIKTLLADNLAQIAFIETTEEKTVRQAIISFHTITWYKFCRIQLLIVCLKNTNISK